WICKDPKDVPMVIRTKNPASQMGWGSSAANGSSYPHISSAQRRRSTGGLPQCPQDCRRPLDGLCGLRDPIHIPAGLGARPQGQTCAVLAEEECAQL
ncbi:Transposable element tcb2 transposase, partial [Caligus rogercresseyi]